MRLFQNIEGHPDRDFLAIVENVAIGSLAETGVGELFLIEVKNWFDHKWLGFSGIGRVRSSLPLDLPKGLERHHSVPAAFRMAKITLPPFSPTRVLSQRHFQRTGDDFAEAEPSVELYSRVRRPSSANLHRGIKDISLSAVFVWYCSNATANGEASLMVYISVGGEVYTWLASFRRKSTWQVKGVKAIRTEHLESLMCGAAAAR